MTVRLYAMTCGWLTMSLGDMLEGETGMIKIPIPSYLIEHPKGKAVFDTGLHPDLRTDPDKRLGNFAGMFTFDFPEGNDLGSRLQSLQVDPNSINYMINSHLHFDHCGGNYAVPNATRVIQKREWQAGQDADMIQNVGYAKHDYDLGHDVKEVAGEHDLFGDGSVTCVPTYGHTPGHQSLRVKLDSGDVLLCGDACYLRRSLEEMRLPRILYDRDQMMKSFQLIKELQNRGARIFYGHDPDFWKALPQAPAQIQ
jgi:glyoxylase-like metal-dependent hydrolase (beta-lactamase superfamily II)